MILTWPTIAPLLLLAMSNVFMTFAWYWHLRFTSVALPIVIAASWGIALFEHLIQVPANRIGYRTFSLGQLKVMQEVITMVVFAGFLTWYMRQPITLDYLWAGLCLIGAAYFMYFQFCDLPSAADPLPMSRA